MTQNKISVIDTSDVEDVLDRLGNQAESDIKSNDEYNRLVERNQRLIRAIKQHREWVNKHIEECSADTELYKYLNED